MIGGRIIGKNALHLNGAVADHCALAAGLLAGQTPERGK